MADLDSGEVTEDRTLTDDEFEYLELLAHSSRVKFDRQIFRVSVENNGSYVFFFASSVIDGSGRSFMCKKEDKLIMAMNGCDLSWIKAFMNGYKLVED